MIVSLLVLVIVEILMLFATLEKSNKAFENVMTAVLIVVYLSTIAVYVPLYVTVMKRLKKLFPDVHNKIKTKANILFSTMMMLLTIRFGIYCSVESNYFKFFKMTEPATYIPFFVSEIFLAISYIIFLIKVYKKKVLEIEREKEQNT